MLIDIQGCNINIDDRSILKDIRLTVDTSDFVYIIGRVGSGKSTFLKALYAEHQFENGTAQVLDMNLVKLPTRDIPELRRKLGIVFQDCALLQHRTVEENLEFVLKATGWHRAAERKQRIAEVLGQVGIEDKNKRYPHELSGGEQQRVAIARALLNHPRLILADEPTGNLDSETGQQILRLLRSLTEKGTAVIMVTHNRHFLTEFPGRVFMCGDEQLQDVTYKYSKDVPVPLKMAPGDTLY